jgi:hypothetical protein
VAIEPAVTIAVSVVKDGGVVDPDVAESTSNCSEFEVPPPRAVCTVMVVIPAAAMFDAGTYAVSWVPLTNCVERAVLPQRTVEPDVNPDPVTVSVTVIQLSQSQSSQSEVGVLASHQTSLRSAEMISPIS